LGTWKGDASSFALPGNANGLRTAILVQGKYGGPILSAKSD
jgi:hypothetical protein